MEGPDTVPCKFYVHGYLWKTMEVPAERVFDGGPHRMSIPPEISMMMPPRPTVRAIRFKGKLPPVCGLPIRPEIHEVMFYIRELRDRHGMMEAQRYFCDDPRVAIGEKGRLFLR